jgi:DNA-binding protein H-NS
MGNLIDIQSQIEKLQKQAADIRSREFNTTVQDILAKMAAFDITVKDLEVARKKAPKGRAKAAAKATGGRRGPKKGAGASSVAPKYRGPNGETWTGRGLMPRWLSALVASGRTKEEFAIKA